ncbi:MAG: choice-of-anchor D domain-containing protein [Burkholderiales bacterium]
MQQGGMPMASGDVLQFGTQTKGGLYAAKSIALLNGGTQGNLDVVLPAAGSIAGFTFTAGNGCNSLAPAAVCTVDIRFDPAAVQAYDSVLSIQTSPAGSPGVVSEFHLSLKGQGTDSAVPTLRWTNDSGTPVSQLGFDPTDTSAPTVKTIRLYNDGKGGALLQLANLVGLDASNFRLDTTDCPKDKVLYEATSCALVVTFSPSTPGLKTASIQFTASGSTPPSLVVAPLMVASGTGTGVAVPASLQISSTALNLGATTVGAAGLPQELTLSNSGSRVVRVLAMDVSAPFSVQGKTCASPPFELAPGTGCTINVTVTPQAEGPLAGMLIVTTDGTPATQQVALSANAEPKADVSSGGGCSIATGDSVLDPMLWLMGALAFAVLVARRREPTARGDDANCKGGR